MKLIPVDAERDSRFLYELFTQRPEEARVSSRAELAYEEHLAFVRSHPYADWCLIQADNMDLRFPSPFGGGTIVGAISLSQPARPSISGDEISIDLLPQFYGIGLGEMAIALLVEKHGQRRYLANIACRPIGPNYRAMAFFAKLGFKDCQMTMELDLRPPPEPVSQVLWRNRGPGDPELPPR